MAKTTTKTSNGANLGFEQTLWKAADKLRGSMDPSEYKHVVLGLMFLKYISDGFEEQYQKTRCPKINRRGPRRPGRIPRRERLLGTSERALDLLAE